MAFGIALKNLITNRTLVYQLLRSEIAGRYRGTFLGFFWAFLNPVFMLLLYFLLFGYIFAPRWDTGGSGKGAYALFIFGGIIIHSLFAEVIGRSPDLIVNRPNFVKKVVFPLEVLPIATCLSALFHFLVGFGIYCLLAIYAIGFPSLASFAGLFSLPCLFLMICGFSFMLASLGVYLRDLGQIIGQLITATMFLSPVLYPVSALPEILQPIIMLNPISFPIESVRGLFAGQPADYTGLAIYAVVSVSVFICGLWWFASTRKGFADVI